MNRTERAKLKRRLATTELTELIVLEVVKVALKESLIVGLLALPFALKLEGERRELEELLDE